MTPTFRQLVAGGLTFIAAAVVSYMVITQHDQAALGGMLVVLSTAAKDFLNVTGKADQPDVVVPHG